MTHKRNVDDANLDLDSSALSDFMSEMKELNALTPTVTAPNESTSNMKYVVEVL